MEIPIRPGQVYVPRSILLDPRLTDQAKIAWAAYQLGPASQRQLAELAGLCRHSAVYSLSLLRQFGLLRSLPIPKRPGLFATVPVDLLRSTTTLASQKVLYAVLQVLPGYQSSAVITGYSQLREVTGRSHPTIRKSLQHLHDSGWIIIDRPGARRAFSITVRNPHVEAQQQQIAAVEHRLRKAPYFGEGLMREWLNILVDSTDFEDNATPGFLINPYTSEEMQIDRLYWQFLVGFEFNGAQHYGPTPLYPDPEAARRQQGRDLIKQAICRQRGILLIPVHSDDLSLAGMLRLIPDRLPLRCLEGQEILVAHLEALSAAYRQRTPLPPPTKKDPPGLSARGDPNLPQLRQGLY